MALYLTYRPQRFPDVVGQDHIVTTLERAVASNQISHAYLFSGTRGTGKTSVARILAKTILLKGTEDPILRGHIEKGAEDGSLVDLVEIDAASNRRIDDVRELIERISFSPSVSKAKVYIIDEVHMLTKEAFNALLKTLEEPPDYAFFILATTELHKVPDTIQSRCQRFLFKRVKDDDIVRRLQYIADQEKIQVDRDALRAIARNAGGSFRDGIALLDQLRSLPKITFADVADRIGRTSAECIEDIVVAIGNKDLSRIAAIVEEIETANIPVDSVAGDLLSLIREHMHTAIEKKEPVDTFLRMTEILLSALKDMRSSPIPALVLESALVRLCGTLHETTSEKSNVPAPKLTVKQPPTTELNESAAKQEEEKEETTATTFEAEELTTENIVKHWAALLKALPSPSVRMSMKDASVGEIHKNTVDLVFASSFHREKVADTAASHTVENALLAIFKRPVRIRCVLEREIKMASVGPETDLAEAAEEVFGSI